MKERFEIIYDNMTFNPATKLYECDICGKRLSTENGIYQHIKNKHISEIIQIQHNSIKI